jgi:glycosyltransferase involved in cell wall biosynthesis
MKLSIIIPTKNRAKVLVESIKRFGEMDGEIIVVDDGSDLNNWKIEKTEAGNNPKVKLIKNKGCGPAAARNTGMDVAKGEVLVFLNDDTRVKKDYFKHVVEFHKDREKTEALVGPMRTSKEVLVASKTTRWLEKNKNINFNYKDFEDGQEIPSYYFWTCNLSVKRKFFVDSDLRFNQKFTMAAWEDIEMGYRCFGAGLRLFFDKHIECEHYHAYEWEDIWRRFYNHGRGMYWFGREAEKQHWPLLLKLGINKWGRLASWLPIDKVLKSVKINWEPVADLLIVWFKIKGYEAERKMCGM